MLRILRKEKNNKQQQIQNCHSICRPKNLLSSKMYLIFIISVNIDSIIVWAFI